MALPALLPARLVARPNRFLVVAETREGPVRAACRDPGRLAEILTPGVELRLAPASGPHRATRFDLVLARHRRRWVSVVPDLANRVVEAALEKGDLPGFAGARLLRREVSLGSSRFDFMLQSRRGQLLLEVKSVTWVSGRRGLFPDAPTERGRRHVEELTQYRLEGGRATVLFVAQRGDIDVVSPHPEVDPALSRALGAARRAGVALRACGCRVSERGVSIIGRLPVELGYQPRS